MKKSSKYARKQYVRQVAKNFTDAEWDELCDDKNWLEMLAAVSPSYDINEVIKLGKNKLKNATAKAA